MKIQLIENIEVVATRLWSMRLMIATTIYTAAAGAWVVIPPEWQPHIPEGVRYVLAGIGVALPALAAVSRVVAQPKLQQVVQQHSDADKAGA